MKALRCAVYTRKSTEDGLEQQFNSLDAQREACEAYILSQRHEGWTLVPGRYDDGGFSGGNIERPGLKALLAEVDAGNVDVIVVYKVDRLTRSLADFAKIVERLDARQASFVSITQAFNTTTSMGRLTLNVLLSFAQFEREVTGERIRDKIAASKKKGIWMGGPVPLGYQVIERKLIPVPEEAARVCKIMQLYLAATSVDTMLDHMRSIGFATKSTLMANGTVRGGIPFTRGGLFHILGNAIYIGKIVHKGVPYEGEHESIVPIELWEAVQAKLKANAPPRRGATNAAHYAMLRGLLTDPHGRIMVPTYACRHGRRHAYYETRKDLARPHHPPATRFRQSDLDRHLVEQLNQLLCNEHGLSRIVDAPDGETLRTIFAHAEVIKAGLVKPGQVEAAIRLLVTSITVSRDDLQLCLALDALGIAGAAPHIIKIPLPVSKPFREAKVRIDGRSPTTNRELIDLLVAAGEAQGLAMSSPDLSIRALADRERRCRRRLMRLLRLSWLSPRIVDAIANGTQPRSLTPDVLMTSNLPVDWTEQEQLFGFAA